MVRGHADDHDDNDSRGAGESCDEYAFYHLHCGSDTFAGSFFFFAVRFGRLSAFPRYFRNFQVFGSSGRIGLGFRV